MIILQHSSSRFRIIRNSFPRKYAHAQSAVYRNTLRAIEAMASPQMSPLSEGKDV